jgi:uncharacterized protein YwgA
MLSETLAILLACFLAGADGLLRTSMQKILYFASQKGILEDSFGRGYYGPFSADIANSAESLVSTNFLNETVEFFLKSIGYRYSLTSDGNKIIPELQKQIPTNSAEELGKIVDLCRNRTATSLSIAAKVHYIIKRMNIPMTAEQIASQAEKLKWSISPEEVVEASKLLEELELIK